MAAATAPVNTSMKPGEFLSAPIAANTKIHAGTLVAINATGNAVPAADAANLKVAGRSEDSYDNTGGLAGVLSVLIRRGVFQLQNSATDPVVQADILTTVFVADDQTIRTDGGTNSVKAGLCVGLDAEGVWVDTTLAPAL